MTGVQIGLVNYRFSDDEPLRVFRMSVRLVKSWRGLGYGGHKYLDEQLVRLYPQLNEVIFAKEMRFFAPETATVLNQWASNSTIFFFKGQLVHCHDFYSPSCSKPELGT